MAEDEQQRKPWQNRIVGHGMADPNELMANPLNWRVHPQHQKHALKDVLDQVGWVAEPKVNVTTGHLVDGHLRVQLGIEEGEPEIPVEYVELTEEEERLVLASLDPLANLAIADSDNLAAVLEGVNARGKVLAGMLEDLAGAHPPANQSLAPPEPPNPEDFWPRVQFQVHPNVYTEWRDRWENLPYDTDNEKAMEVLRIMREHQPEGE